MLRRNIYLAGKLLKFGRQNAKTGSRSISKYKQHERSFLSMDRSRLFRIIFVLSIFPFVPARAEPPRDCSAGNSRDRQRCEEAFSRNLRASNRTTELPGGWRLVKTADLNGGPDAVSIMHISDTSKSDFNLAGLTLRCGRGSPEILLIVLEPLPHGSHPSVIIGRAEFEASAVQGGEALLLPPAASSLAAGDWQKATELSVEIAIGPVPIRGVVPIAGLSTALQLLSQNCAVR